MERIRYGIIQAIILTAISVIAAFTFNAFSENGINPFRKMNGVPVVEGFQTEEAEGIKVVGLDEFRSLLDGGGIVLDSRTAADYEQGHIPGAMLLDYFEFGSYVDSVTPYLSFDEEFAIYCTGPYCDDSELLARELFALGYRKINVFRGGIEGWTEAGLPLETGMHEY